MNKQTPGYLHLLQKGELSKRVWLLFSMLSSCRLCPWKCGIDRTKGEKGRCRASNKVKVAKAIPHFGEEPVISGTMGSGTIFFSHCNLKCCYCQNHQISQDGLGKNVSVEELSLVMLELQEKGCHNINLVSAAHYLPFIAEALYLAARDGLCIPMVYNTNGYEDAQVLRLLDGIVDIYLPDAKYANDTYAMKYSSAKNYSRVNFRAIQEMFRQVGCTVVDSEGIALKGLIVRHLVLPRGLSGTRQVLRKLKKHFGPFVSISLMGQYTPCYNARNFKETGTRTSREEYLQAVEILESLGFENGWTQDWQSIDKGFIPDFTKSDSWN